MALACKNETEILQRDNFQITNHELTQNQKDTIFKYISAYPNETEISLAFINDTNTLFIGLKRVNDSVINVDNKDRLFEIGSITKIFTTSILANLAVKGDINIHSDIQNFFDFKLKESSKSGKFITLEMLASHTSGLPIEPKFQERYRAFNRYNEYKKFSNSKLEYYLKNKMELRSVPGETYQYSNIGMAILGYILENYTGKSYDQLCKEYYFDKYQMNSSVSEYNPNLKNVVQGLNKKGEPIPNPYYNADKYCGAILSTANDLSRFVYANFSDDEGLKYQRQKVSEMNEKLDTSLGWVIGCSLNDENWIWHSGGCVGYRTCLAIDVENKTSVIVLSNVSTFHENSGDIDNLCFRLLETINYSNYLVNLGCINGIETTVYTRTLCFMQKTTR